MRIMGLFDKYFLVLMIIEGSIAIFIDPIKFNESGMVGTAKKSKGIGIFLVIISISLYLVTKFFS